MPWKQWGVGEEVLQADFQPLVQNQVVVQFATFAALKAAITAPADGMTAVTLDDGRRYTFRAAATAYPSGINAPANRWETVAMQTLSNRPTDTSGTVQVLNTDLNVDGIIAALAQVNWTAARTDIWFSSSRLVSSTNLQVRCYVGAASSGTTTVNEAISHAATLTALVWLHGWKV